MMPLRDVYVLHLRGWSKSHLLQSLFGGSGPFSFGLGHVYSNPSDRESGAFFRVAIGFSTAYSSTPDILHSYSIRVFRKRLLHYSSRFRGCNPGNGWSNGVKTGCPEEMKEAQR